MTETEDLMMTEERITVTPVISESGWSSSAWPAGGSRVGRTLTSQIAQVGQKY